RVAAQAGLQVEDAADPAVVDEQVPRLVVVVEQPRPAGAQKGNVLPEVVHCGVERGPCRLVYPCPQAGERLPAPLPVDWRQEEGVPGGAWAAAVGVERTIPGRLHFMQASQQRA